MIRALALVVVVVLGSGSLVADAAPRAVAAQPKRPGVLPQQIDSNMIMFAVARVSSKIRGCMTGLTFNGRVDLDVVVSPTGGVTSVTVKQTPHEYLGRCMSEAMRKATFPKTAKGGTFTRSIAVSPKPV